jgi:hypothetical protein
VKEISSWVLVLYSGTSVVVVDIFFNPGENVVRLGYNSCSSGILELKGRITFEFNAVYYIKIFITNIHCIN